MRDMEINKSIKIKEIVCGYQTGSDLAGADIALDFNIPLSGYCPKGRRYELGKIPEKYPAIETEESTYPPRTRKNIEISDGTLIIIKGKISGGSLLTKRICLEIKKPFLVINISSNIIENIINIRKWILLNNIKVLNVAGNRESKSKIYKEAYALLYNLLTYGNFK
jgi:hypothetical protein